MDVFQLISDGVSTYNNGATIDRLTSKLWIERFLEPGEFKFTGPPTNYLRYMLPLGMLISHSQSKTIMMVEDHEIVEDKDSPPVMTISGRSVDAFLEHRVSTDDDQGFNPSLSNNKAKPYEFLSTKSWLQAVDMIEQQIESPPTRAVLAIPFVDIRHEITASELSEDREVKRQSLAESVKEILSDLDAGIKIERPVQGVHAKIWFVIHQGVDRRSTVHFSYVAGDIENARYFWSMRDSKNAAYIASEWQGKYVARSGSEGASGWNRRVMKIDASDFEANPNLSAWSSELAIAKLDSLLTRRAKKVLARRKNKEMMEATIARNNRYRFRRDYDIGDIVKVYGNYGLISPYRVTEYAEIEDESGESGYPTLSALN